MGKIKIVFAIPGVYNYDDEKSASLQDMWGEDWAFNGVNTFAHLNHTKCLLNPEEHFDIGIIGLPFDTATSYRPGTRFGPRAIRAASQRQNSLRSFNFRAGYSPLLSWAKIIDCGDVPITPMDNHIALNQMTVAFDQLLNYTSNSELLFGKPPRYIALGGDHSILLPHLRALKKHYGKITVIHFDAHLDTWLPTSYPSFWHSNQSEFTHGSMLWMAHEEGLLSEKENNFHIGVRTRLSGSDSQDYDNDDLQGFKRIDADDVWLKGVEYVYNTVKNQISKQEPVYISVDIDVLDPGFAPGTGTIEPGGLLPRELIYLLRKFEFLNIVGADIVEVSPGYDHSEITATNAAQVVFEIMTSMTKKIDFEKNSFKTKTEKHQFLLKQQ
ncbi:hypothetical protein PACTADRAFT_52182 [Pachysolen tannophilus NRRL Y-2460]|uniref:Agmatinase n=1 Tax=Pachysolen tannophilus NRRL Y-2460 TaxID=669874 RepID=A0A1E4TN22_PACTA|nr:hypothetical protein PACTADRAFT_52182 [Pachysolen tannophilus NRRL Y-2460]